MAMDNQFDLRGKRVWVAGHRGMVGGALVRRLQSEDCVVLTAGRAQLDLRRQAEVEKWIAEQRPDLIFVAAATVGGIYANDTRPAEFLYDNLAIESNIIHAAYQSRVRKLMFLGSSCIYPKLAAQPMTESALLTGPLEPTNQWYAIAKIAGIFLCRSYRKQYGCDFISAMPTNLYGPGDYFDPLQSHVAPALMLKMHKARLEGTPTVTVWGSGKPQRELLYVDDLADALVFLAKTYSDEEHVNVGYGSDITIRELAETMAKVTGFRGALEFDSSKPDGAPRKLMDCSRLNALGWKASTSLEEGLKSTYAWFTKNIANREQLRGIA
jgi:GDP-L-fucose synthase